MNELKNNKLQLSFDDYHEQNYKLAELLMKYDLPAIFFIEAGTEEKREQIKNLADMGFTIGGHSFTHPQDLKLLSDQDLKYEIVSCREVLKDLCGQRIDTFCFPRGRRDERVIKVVKEAGYKYARTTELGVGGDNFEQKCYHCFQRPEYNGEEWFDIVKRAYDDNEGNVKIWGHCFEFERDKLWGKLEEFFKHITK